MASDSVDPFGDYELSYGRTVDDVVAFSHQGHAFYTEAKVRHLVDVIDRHVGPPTHQRLLDVGCGPGMTDALLAPQVASVDGVDVSDAMVTEATRANPKGAYQLYDGDSLPYEDNTFDVTFAICVFHHVPPESWAAFAAEVGRVTRPGGLSVVFEHNPFNPLTRRAVRDCPFDEGVVLLNRSEVSNLYKDAGLTVVERRYMMFVPLSQKVSAAADRALGWCPIGAQYYVAARPST